MSLALLEVLLWVVTLLSLAVMVVFDPVADDENAPLYLRVLYRLGIFIP